MLFSHMQGLVLEEEGKQRLEQWEEPGAVGLSWVWCAEDGSGPDYTIGADFPGGD